MFRQARMAAVLVIALSFAPGRANDPGPSFGGWGAQCAFPLEGRLYERLRLTGHASFGRFEVWAKRVKDGQVFDVAFTCRNAAGKVFFWGQAAVMELRSDRGGKRLLARMQNVTAQGSDGSFSVIADRVWEIERPGRP